VVANLRHFMYKQQREGDVSDVAAETQLENVAAGDDDRVSRREITAHAGHRVVRDEMADDVHFRQVRVTSHVEVAGRETSDCA